jgi:hypothetical protein
VSNDLKNFARGGNTYHHHRLEIARQWLDRDAGQVEPLSPFLTKKFLALDAKAWSAFSFGPKDWEICERLATASSAALETNYLYLVLTYAAVNKKSVDALFSINREMSAQILSTGQRSPINLDKRMDKACRQSLFAFRVEATIQRGSADGIRDALYRQFTNSWCRARLLYPLVYRFVTPTAGLDRFLSYVVTGHEHKFERIALQLLLCNEAARTETLAFKAYVGLMGHPYDALEIILDHIELAMLSPLPLATHLHSFLEYAARLFPGTRVERLAEQNQPRAAQIREEATSDAMLRWVDLSPAQATSFSRFCSLGVTEPAAANAIPDIPTTILADMRACPYPVATDFQTIAVDHATHFFLDSGHFLGALLRSIYMVERTDRDLEARDAFRLYGFLGVLTPFLMSTPSALQMVSSAISSGRLTGASLPDLEDITGTALAERRPFDDRLWINDFQWRLHSLERKGKLTQWLALVRTEAKLKPSYLTGINWLWLEEMIDIVRLDPFINYEGALLFLLMDFETTNVDQLRLQLALEPFVKDKGLQETIALLIREYQEVALAFVRRFLTVDNLIRMGLAPTVFAALSMRLVALEACLNRFGFGPVMTEDMYESEAKALTAELLLNDVNAGKFEVPWDMFRRDMVERQQDLFLAFCSLQPYPGEDSTLNAFTETPHVFRNGRKATYRYRLFQHPLVLLMLSVIDSFMEHPAYGLEVILSGRFRHNVLLQEVWLAISAVVEATIPSVPRHVQQDLSQAYRDAVETIIERWCSQFMQSRRDAKLKGLFDIVLDAKEFEQLLAGAETMKDSTTLTDYVIGWIQRRLKPQIRAAGEKFAADMKVSVETEFARIREIQLQTSRPSDAQKVYVAVSNAVLRRIDTLQTWFDGIDAITSNSITLHDLAHATQRLFEGVIPGRKLHVTIPARSGERIFAPNEVKIAFDLIREIFFNALKKGVGPDVRLRMNAIAVDGQAGFVFSNRCGSPVEEGVKTIEGSRYEGKNDGVLREGNSGLLKVASSAATLVGHDTTVSTIVRNGFHHLLVPFGGGHPSCLS